MAKKSRGGTIVATGSAANMLFKAVTEPKTKPMDTGELHRRNGAEAERSRITQILRAKIYALKSDPAWVKSPTEATLVGAYEELIKEIEKGEG